MNNGKIQETIRILHKTTENAKMRKNAIPVLLNGTEKKKYSSYILLDLSNALSFSRTNSFVANYEEKEWTLDYVPF